MSGWTDQPRVRRNDWPGLPVPPVGSPQAQASAPSVSVVVPAYDAGALLPTVLAALAAQSHPAHLLEVVVVNDGPAPLALPEVRPERTRIIDAGPGGWGRAHACHVGALAAEGDVLHWLDADMLAERHEVAAQARWHAVIDHAVVLGERTFVDPAPALALTPEQVREAVAADRVGELFPAGARQGHGWVEEMYGRTDRLASAGWFAVRAHVGMTGSVRRELYLESGGMDPRLRLGEDTALGVRLGEVGAVFVPDVESVSWHLGLSNVMRRSELVNVYNAPHLADGSPVLRPKRHRGRTYPEPYLEVVLDPGLSGGADPLDVTATVDAVLAGTLHDVRVLLLGPWSSVSDDRVRVLDDPGFDVRLVHATYAAEPRVRLLERLPPGRAGAPFRMTLPGAAWAPRPPALERLLLHLEHTHDGRRTIELPDGTAVRVERTAAVSRARRLVSPGESLDAVVDEVAGSLVLDGRHRRLRPQRRRPPAGLPPHRRPPGRRRAGVGARRQGARPPPPAPPATSGGG